MFSSLLEELLGHAYSDTPKSRGRRAPGEGQIVLGSDLTWEQIDQAEEFDRVFASEKPVERVLADHPWLAVCERVADDQGFFHWDLDFSPVFALGGFDLQVGNPPWYRPRIILNGLLAEVDPWWSLATATTASQEKERLERALGRPGALDVLTRGVSDTAASSKFFSNKQVYPILAGQTTDLYRNFIALAWKNSCSRGVVTLIHMESVFTEEKADKLRRELYLRLRSHYQFTNVLKLFDIKDSKKYAICTYGPKRAEPNFIQASHLFHPTTVLESLRHDGTGMPPGLKDDENRWDRTPHLDRIVAVNKDRLQIWAEIAGDAADDWDHARTMYSTCASIEDALTKMVRSPRAASLHLDYRGGLTLVSCV